MVHVYTQTMDFKDLYEKAAVPPLASRQVADLSPEHFTLIRYILQILKSWVRIKHSEPIPLQGDICQDLCQKVEEGLFLF